MLVNSNFLYNFALRFKQKKIRLTLRRKIFKKRII